MYHFVLALVFIIKAFKGPVHHFSMEVVMNKCFFLNLVRKKRTFNSEKRRHRTEG